jgi:hypothetical protein
VKALKKVRSKNCMKPHLQDKLILYLSGSVSPKQHRLILKHLPQCSYCRKELRFLVAAQKIELGRIR